jgi:hypothetical protein
VILREGSWFIEYILRFVHSVNEEIPFSNPVSISILLVRILFKYLNWQNEGSHVSTVFDKTHIKDSCICIAMEKYLFSEMIYLKNLLTRWDKK